jgi:NAD+ synthase
MPTATTPQCDTTHVYNECARLGIIPTTRVITGLVSTFASKVSPQSRVDKTVLGNLTARCRMALLYAHANSCNGVVCGTGNLTEYYLGYTTKWGDNAADFFPILHLYKTEVWELARTLGVIPEIIEKPPSAGLWEGQTDEGEIGMSYGMMDGCIYRLLDRTYSGPATPEMNAMYDRHVRNVHKSSPGRSLLCYQ